MPVTDSSQRPAGSDQFATTRWSLVLAAGEPETSRAGAALEELCAAYWLPVYVHVRHRVSDVHEAQDLTQAFFERLLEKEAIAAANPERGRFRAFLLTACKRFLVNKWHKLRAEKRGGGRRALSLDFDSGESQQSLQAVDELTPERSYERQWAITLLARVLGRLENEFETKGKRSQFEELKPFLTGRRSSTGYAAVAEKLGMTEGAVKVAAHRLRSRYRELLRTEIAQTVETPEEVEDEIRRLFVVLGSEKGSNRM